MNTKLHRLAQRRERLVAQISAQRVALVEDIEPWRMPLGLADQGLSALRYLGRHPEWIAGAVVLVVALGPGRAGKWLGRGWVTWRVMHRLSGR
jgi:hypothetical protein